MPTFAQIEEAKFKKKFDELHLELEGLARAVGAKAEERDKLISEIGAKEKERDRVFDSLISLQGKLVDLENDIEKKESKSKDLTTAQNRQFSSHQIRMKELDRMESEVRKSVDALKREIKDLDKKKKELVSVEKAIVVATKKLGGIQKEVETTVKKSEVAMTKLSKVQASVDEKLKKEREYFVTNQRDARKLEHYVKRLQRYYDQNGIKLNILNEFEIKQDNNGR